MVTTHRGLPIDNYEAPDWEEVVRGMCAKNEQVEGAVMPVLEQIQEHFGYLSEGAILLTADLLHLTPPQVYAVATYYHEFRLEKPASVTIMLCRGPACRIDGMVAIRKRMEDMLGIEVGGRTPDDKFAIETSGCLGICPHAPAILLNHDLVGRVTPAMIEHFIEAGSSGELVHD